MTTLPAPLKKNLSFLIETVLINLYRFISREMRTNENIRIDKERGVMTMNPKLNLRFLPEQSIADLENVTVKIPNIALIVSIISVKQSLLLDIGLPQVSPQ